MGAFTSARIQDREGFKAVLQSRISDLQQRKSKLKDLSALAGQVQQSKEDNTKEIDEDIEALETEIRRQTEKIRVLQGIESIEAIIAGVEPPATSILERETISLVQSNVGNGNGDPSTVESGVMSSLRARLGTATK